MILVAEFPAIPSSALKIASERRCAILVHSGPQASEHCVLLFLLGETNNLFPKFQFSKRRFARSTSSTKLDRSQCEELQVSLVVRG